jgi:AraC family cel operon transcriptional repressor
MILAAGDIMLIRPAHRHSVQGMPGAGTKVNLAFPATVLRDLERRYGDIWGSDQAPPVVRHVSADVIADLSRRADHVRHGPDDRLAQDAFLLTLLQHLRPAGDRLWRNAPTWLADALAALSEPPALTDGITALVRLTGRTREHISRTLRSTCGTTPIKIIDDLRLRWCERQLVMSDVSIQELAELCGLGRVHLHRRFTARYGCSPRTWRTRSRATT